MYFKFAATIMCLTAPAALVAQQVDLRSSDEFISVSGEITGFNGVMLRVQTTVGPVSVPASEVICYGDGCVETLANNDFGLTEDAFAGVVAASAQATPAAPAETPDNLTIGFVAPAYATLFDSAVAAASNAEGNGAGGASVSAADGTTITLSLADTADDADLRIGAVSLIDGATGFGGPSEWAGASASMSQQLLALDAFSVLIAPSAGMDAISVSDLSRVLSGEVTNWSQIGGADLGVLALRLPPESPIQQDLEALVMEPFGRSMSNSILTMGDEGGIAASVNQFPGSISVVTAANADTSLAVPVTGSCDIPVSATPFNIASGDYPLVRPVMVSYGDISAPSSLVQLFDAASADLSGDLGFAGYAPTAQDNQIKNARINGLLTAELDDAQRAVAAQMFQTLFAAERLSTTFAGGAVTGPQGGWNRAMMDSLLDTLAAGDYAGREVLFAGFATSDSGSADAIAQSEAAAVAVRDAVNAAAAERGIAGNLTFTSAGYGDVAPSACIDLSAGETGGSRVEVWLR